MAATIKSTIVPLTSKYSHIVHHMNVQIISPSNVPTTAACTHWTVDKNCLGYEYNHRNMQIHIRPVNLPSWSYAYDLAMTHEITHCIQFNAGFHKKHTPVGPHNDYWLGTLQDLFCTTNQLPQEESGSKSNC